MTNQQTLLIVEDDPDQLEHYLSLLRTLDYQVISATTKDAAIGQLKKYAVDVLITDIHLTQSAGRDSYEGYEIIISAQDICPECLILAMSNDPKTATFHKAKALGAYHMLKKPVCAVDEFRDAISVAEELREAQRNQDRLSTFGLSDDLIKKCPDGLVFSDAVRETVDFLAHSTDTPALILGETGTGKEEIANLIKRKRQAREGREVPLVALNCANLDNSTAASELFGHTRGSFTGADKTTIGFIREADKGILFLDEIHALSIDCQRRLLRVLNDGSYQRLGDPKTLRSKFQIIAATVKDIDTLVEEGSFLKDLRARINGVFIHLPPLRDRLSDLDLLVPLILAKRKARVTPKDLQEIIERCKKFYWQDNIRQLFSVLKATVEWCKNSNRPLTAAEIRPITSMYPPRSAKEMAAVDIDGKIPKEIVDAILAPLLMDAHLKKSMIAYERLIISYALDRHKRIQDVSEALKVPRTTLSNRRKDHDL